MITEEQTGGKRLCATPTDTFAFAALLRGAAAQQAPQAADTARDAAADTADAVRAFHGRQVLGRRQGAAHMCTCNHSDATRRRTHMGRETRTYRMLATVRFGLSTVRMRVCSAVQSNAASTGRDFKTSVKSWVR